MHKNKRNETAKDLFKNGDGKLISFVNYHFGPIRDLYFIIVNVNEKDLKKYLINQPVSTIDSIWSNTLIATRAIELPMKLLKELNEAPAIVNSFEDGEKRILELVDRGNLSGDPFFFRSFIL